MTTTEATTLLQDKIEERILNVSKKRSGDKTWATLLKLGSVSLAGIVTILVGLQGKGFDQYLLRNLALVFGALITVVNAFDAFLDFKGLWINRTITLGRLYALQMDVKFEAAKADPEQLSEEILTSFHKRLGNIMRDDLQRWMKLRTQPGDEELQKFAAESRTPLRTTKTGGV